MKKVLMTLSAAAALTCCITPPDEITSSAPYLDTSVSDTTLSPDPHFLTVQVRANRTFEVTTDCSWLTAGLNGESLDIGIELNTEKESRSGSVILASINNDVFRKITITQAKSDICFDNLCLESPDKISRNHFKHIEGYLMLGKHYGPLYYAVDDRTYGTGPSKINDSHIGLVTEQMKSIESRCLFIVGCEITEFPCDIVDKNGIDRLYLAWNESLTSLPEASVLAGCNLTRLSIAGTGISDISNLSSCRTLEWVDVSSTAISDLRPLLGSGSLKTLWCDKTPLTYELVDAYQELYPGITLKYKTLLTESTPLPSFGEITTTEAEDGKLEISVPVTCNEINSAGFYVGYSHDTSEMTFHQAEYREDGTMRLTLEDADLSKVLYIRAKAANAAGENFSILQFHQENVPSESVFIRSQAELDAFDFSRHEYIHGSLYIGNISTEPSDDAVAVQTEDGPLYFLPSDISDLSPLSGISYIKDGLYICNTEIAGRAMKAINGISHMRILWLKGNERLFDGFTLNGKYTATLEELNVSRCDLSHVPVDSKCTPVLKKLYYGDIDNPDAERNSFWHESDIENLKSLTCLEYLDLGGVLTYEEMLEEIRNNVADGCVVVY